MSKEVVGAVIGAIATIVAAVIALTPTCTKPADSAPIDARPPVESPLDPTAGKDPTPPGPQPKGPDVAVAVEIKAVKVVLRTEFDNLDTQTKVYVTIRDGEEVLANQIQVAQGEVAENTTHDEVLVPLTRFVSTARTLTIEITHPGIPSNGQPHWRMTFAVSVVMTDGTVRSSSVNLATGLNYTDKKFGHLNFVDKQRSSGRITIALQ